MSFEAQVTLIKFFFLFLFWGLGVEWGVEGGGRKHPGNNMHGSNPAELQGGSVNQTAKRWGSLGREWNSVGVENHQQIKK